MPVTTDANLPACLNCNAPLTGLYCASCGQKHIPSIPSMTQSIGEIIETLTYADSRLWRTLGLLLVKPGELPSRYFAGKRASVLPPLRLYLIISIAFFMVLRIDSTLISESQKVSPISIEASETTLATGENPCNIDYAGPFAPYLKNRMIAACEQAVLDSGETLTRRFTANLPKAMFALMPLVAAVMVLWYRRPKRFFMEHLIFQVFNHSALFLAAGLTYVISWIVPSAVASGLELALLPYTFYYCYRSLRTYYQQSRAVTWVKFASLSVAYLILLIMVMAFTGIASIL